jgi:hypothetical protein
MNTFDGRQRRRFRMKQMADDLGISGRSMAKLLAMGVPHTKLGGLIWFEPDLVHAWLDKYNRKGAPGVKRVRGQSVGGSR